jgi:hypothetical protein
MSADKPGTPPDSLAHSHRGKIFRRAPLPAPLLSTSTPKLPKTTPTQVRTQEKMLWCEVWCVLICTPSPCIYRREPPAICPGIEPNCHWGLTTPRHVSSERQWGPWAATTCSADHDGRPAIQRVRSAQILFSRLLGGPSCHVYRFGLVLSRFGGSGGPVDPRECI